MTEAVRRIEKLQRDHAVEGFDCGRQELNRFLLRYAWQNQQAGAAQTYVALAGDTVAGYYTLSLGQVCYDGAPERLTRRWTRDPVLIMLLPRLAVDQRWHAQGIGATLLKDAIERTVQAADIAGVQAIAAHAKDEAARRFYEHFDFAPSPTDPLHLFLSLEHVRSLFWEPLSERAMVSGTSYERIPGGDDTSA